MGAEVAVRRGLESPPGQLTAAASQPTSGTSSHTHDTPAFAATTGTLAARSYARFPGKGRISRTNAFAI